MFKNDYLQTFLVLLLLFATAALVNYDNPTSVLWSAKGCFILYLVSCTAIYLERQRQRRKFWASADSFFGTANPTLKFERPLPFITQL